MISFTGYSNGIYFIHRIMNIRYARSLINQIGGHCVYDRIVMNQYMMAGMSYAHIRTHIQNEVM